MKDGRPDFKDIKSFEEFSRYYWYREELSKICKSLGLEYRSTKQELNHIIEQYFMGNRIEKLSNFIKDSFSFSETILYMGNMTKEVFFTYLCSQESF